MTDTTVVHTDVASAEEAGRTLGEQVRKGLSGNEPDALVLFASPKYDFRVLLQSIHEACRPRLLVGCSSAGEFTGGSARENTACAVAIRSSDIQFAAGIGRNLRADRSKAARDLVSSFRGVDGQAYSFRSVMILTDALAGYAEELIEQINLLTAGTHQLFGGGAGDDAQFQRTHVFCGTEFAQDAAVALEILSNKPVGIGVHHGWVPASEPMRVTESEGTRLISLNAVSAAEMFQEHARATGQQFDLSQPLSFFLHNVLGIEVGGNYKLRVPLQVDTDGSVHCAAEIPTGCTVYFMKTSAESAAQAATHATEAALSQLGPHSPKVAIFFDCVATRLRTGREFGLELDALQRSLGDARFAGCNTYGQIARSEGQFGGFHNCTAVVGVIPG